MRKTMIYLEDDQHVLLQRMAHSQRTSVASLVRLAVDDLLKRAEPARPALSFIGAGEGPADDNVSERPHEEARRILSERQ